jgi:SAM-dependent methyltransferase
MHEILRHLEAGARVLDLGSGEGSFDPAAYPHVVTVHLDAELPPAGGVSNFVLADAARLPFPNASFDAIVANHSLEHVGDLAATLAEMRRVLRPTSTIYIAVPDASTLNDRVYRWLYRGGGHVNAFRDAATLSQRIALATGRPLVAIRVLHASFIFLHRQNFRSRPPRRLWLFANGDPRFIAALTFALRTFDRWLGTRLSVYGCMHPMRCGAIRRGAPRECEAAANISGTALLHLSILPRGESFHPGHRYIKFGLSSRGNSSTPFAPSG